MIVSRQDAMDALLVRAEHAAPVAGRDSLDRLRARMLDALRASLGVPSVVELVPEGALPRGPLVTRVIDDPELYRAILGRAVPSEPRAF